MLDDSVDCACLERPAGDVCTCARLSFVLCEMGNGVDRMRDPDFRKWNGWGCDLAGSDIVPLPSPLPVRIREMAQLALFQAGNIAVGYSVLLHTPGFARFVRVGVTQIVMRLIA